MKRFFKFIKHINFYRLISFFTYYRLLGIVYFLIGLQFTFKTGSITILKYIGLFLIVVGVNDVITGNSMKTLSVIKNKTTDKAKTSTDDDGSDEPKSKPYDNKNIYLKFIKGNAIIAIVTLLIAFTLFMSTESIAKLYFKSNSDKYQASKPMTSDKGIPASNNTTVRTLNKCSKKLYNDKVIINVISIESSKKNTLVNVSIENNAKSSIQISGTKDFSCFSLVDISGNSYKLLPHQSSTKLYDWIDTDSRTELKLAFEPLPSDAEIKKFNGEIWTLAGGVREFPFFIEIK